MNETDLNNQTQKEQRQQGKKFILGESLRVRSICFFLPI